jgi:hypothetical protein
MQNRRVELMALIAAAAVVSGCGLTGPEPAERPQGSGKITVGDKSQQTQSVSCTQDQWALQIDAATDGGRARAYLELGGPELVVRTVNLENIDGLNAVSGGEVGNAEASTQGGNTYRITGTAAVSDPETPGTTRKTPFSIEVPC